MKKLTIAVCLALFSIGISGCKSKKTFVVTKDKTDIVVDGYVELSYLNNAKTFPWYYYGVTSYKPNTSYINSLNPLAAEIGVLIIGGTWCGDTQLNLPKLICVLNAMGVEPNQISVVMLDKDKKSSYFKPGSVQLKHVPTFIFFKDGCEQGRIIEQPKTTIEEDMMNIFKLM